MKSEKPSSFWKENLNFQFKTREWIIVSRVLNTSIPLPKNSKIPKTVFHKLQFNTFRIKFQCLQALPFNFKILGIFAKLLVAFGHFTVCSAAVVWKACPQQHWVAQPGLSTATHGHQNNNISKSWWIIRVTRSKLANITDIA